MQPVPLDTIGQLYISSANLCDGYVGTKHKNFMPNKVCTLMRCILHKKTRVDTWKKHYILLKVKKSQKTFFLSSKTQLNWQKILQISALPPKKRSHQANNYTILYLLFWFDHPLARVEICKKFVVFFFLSIWRQEKFFLRFPDLYKVHIFWEGHKILRNRPLTFDYSTYSQK